MSDPTNTGKPRQDLTEDPSNQSEVAPVGTEEDCPEDDESLECADNVDGIAIVISAQDYRDKDSLREFLDGLTTLCDGRERIDLERHDSNIRVHCPRAMAWKPKPPE